VADERSAALEASAAELRAQLSSCTKQLEEAAQLQRRTEEQRASAGQQQSTAQAQLQAELRNRAERIDELQVSRPFPSWNRFHID
jgi:hypothetical protein